MVWLALLGGCSWLNDVPEDRIPVRAETPREANRVANQVDAAEYKDPTMKPKLNALPEGEASAEPEKKDRWNPVSIPKTVDEKAKPFVFQTATGTKIKSKPFNALDKYPTAAELNVTEQERREMIRDGELEPR